MTIGKRIYWVLALVVVMALAGAAVTLAASLTSAQDQGGNGAQTCDQQDGADEAGVEEVKEAGPDTDNVEEECGAQAANVSADTLVASCSDPTGADDAADDDAEGAKAGRPDTDNIEEQCGDQNEADDSAE